MRCACFFFVVVIFAVLTNFLCAIRGQKKTSEKDSSEKKKRMKVIQIKQEIIEKHECGV